MRLNKRLYDKWLNEGYVLATRTPEEYGSFMRWLAENTNMTWYSGHFPVEFNYWTYYEENSGIAVLRSGTEIGYQLVGQEDKIIEFKDVFLEDNIANPLVLEVLDKVEEELESCRKSVEDMEASIDDLRIITKKRKEIVNEVKKLWRDIGFKDIGYDVKDNIFRIAVVTKTRKFEWIRISESSCQFPQDIEDDRVKRSVMLSLVEVTKQYLKAINLLQESILETGKTLEVSQ